MRSVFISYDHDDQSAKTDVESVRLNSNNLVSFHDSSLSEPVYNMNGHVNRRMPNDPASENVRTIIKNKLNESSKLLVLIGRDTHSSEWVKWEVDTFQSIKNNSDILFMRIKGDSYSSLPKTVYGHSIKNWNMSELNSWLR